jgi:exodeoxyribonuclease V alpha subunit
VRLILVGDPSQLPPIGPGLVLHALAGLPSIPQTELKVVKRQSSASGIPQVAAAIRGHQVPAWAEYQGKGSGVSFVPCDDACLENTVQAIYEDLGGNGTDYAVQILSITNANLGGVKNLNIALHNRYQADAELVMALDAEYGNVAANTLDRISLCVGDLVIFTENNYKLGLRNGSLGRIVEALPVGEPDDPCCRCQFEGAEYLLDSNQVQALSHSYSITVHKSQGSQFTRVIVPIRKSRLLDQTLIYTAVTRGVDQVVLVGDLDATNAAIKAPATAARRNVMLPTLLTKGLK